MYIKHFMRSRFVLDKSRTQTDHTAWKHEMALIWLKDAAAGLGIIVSTASAIALDYVVQPIVGCLLSVELDGGAPVGPLGSRRKPPALPLLVQNDIGYRNLTKLLSAAYLGAEPGDWPHVNASMLAQHSEGLIALTGGPGGPLNRLIVEGQPDAAAALLDRLSAIFENRLYAELQRHGLAEERSAEARLI